MRHLSVHQDHEAEKEAVAVNVIQACADWLRQQGDPERAAKLEAEMLEDGDDERR